MKYIRCMICGKIISNGYEGPQIVTRAFIECPECIEKERGKDEKKEREKEKESKKIVSQFECIHSEVMGAIELLTTTKERFDIILGYPDTKKGDGK